VIRYDNRDKERIVSLAKLLEMNNIQYGSGSGSGKGYNFANGKEESFTIGSNDMVIPAQQAQSAMVKVLMEPRSKLVDSVTYDITAWSLPYVYGVDAYASREKINISGNGLPHPKLSILPLLMAMWFRGWGFKR
jgi:hypothetical protein